MNIKRNVNPTSLRFRLSRSVLTLFILSFFLTGCKIQFGKKQKDEHIDTSAPVKVAPVKRGQINSYLTLNAILEADRQVNIFARTLGIVKDVLVEEGDLVYKDQILARLDDSEQALAVDKAQLNLDVQQSALKRVEDLLQQKMVSDDEHERLLLAVKEAEIILEEIRLALKYTNIAAPFSATVASRNIETGDRVDQSKILFSIVDIDTLTADVWVSEEDLRYLYVGQSAEVTIPSRKSSTQITAKLIRISPIVDPEFGKIKVTFELINKTNLLKPGQYIDLRLILQSKSDVLVISKGSVTYEANKPVVFVSADTIALRRPVILGLGTGDIIEVLSGLKEGEVIVVEGQTTIKDSSKITIVEMLQ